MGTFSSKQFSWNEVSIAIGGRIAEEAEEVEYSVKQEKEVLRGRGNKPHGIVRGNFDYEGKVTLWQSAVEAMIKDAPDKNILALKFDIIVSYAPLDGGETVTDVLVGCEIKEYKKGMKQGDKNMLVELPFIFLDIKNQQ